MASDSIDCMNIGLKFLALDDTSLPTPDKCMHVIVGSRYYKKVFKKAFEYHQFSKSSKYFCFFCQISLKLSDRVVLNEFYTVRVVNDVRDVTNCQKC